ncbi:MAG: hypothetical protein H7334_15055 [Ferruginibacter sp.]|nr:hypothetical protein [Ferruginibacter sp.]
METLIVKIKNKDKVAFTKELLSSFSFLEIEGEKKKPGITAKRKHALVQGFKELKLVEEGKLKGLTATDLLKKLRNRKC